MQLFLSILNPNDEIIICAPYWVSYYQMIRIFKSKANYTNTSIEMTLRDTTQGAKHISKKTKAF